MENQDCEIFDEDEVITLQDDKGNSIDFNTVACVEYEDNFYVLLSPVGKVEGIEDDECIVCKLEDQDDDTQLIVPVEDEELMQKVFDKYLETADECDCGCDCDECDCDDCDCDECDCDEEGHDDECDCCHHKE